MMMMACGKQRVLRDDYVGWYTSCDDDTGNDRLTGIIYGAKDEGMIKMKNGNLGTESHLFHLTIRGPE